MGILDSLIVVGSEVTLALYPILIKTIPTSLDTQLFYRFLVFTVFGFVFATQKDIFQTWGTATGLFRSLGLGALTLLHVSLSYYEFGEGFYCNQVLVICFVAILAIMMASVVPTISIKKIPIKNKKSYLTAIILGSIIFGLIS